MHSVFAVKLILDILIQYYMKLEWALAGIGHTFNLLLNFLISSYIFRYRMNVSYPGKIRYDLNHLANSKNPRENDLFRQYHIIMRMLHIYLPSDSSDIIDFSFKINSTRKDFPKYTISRQDQKPVTPQCMHDCLVSFHANSCEHHTEFFSYWHRWLLFKLQNFFLQAHNRLLNDDDQKINKDAQRLSKNLSQRSSNTNSSKEKIAAQIKIVQQVYRKIVSRLLPEDSKYIGAHYWNIMDFKNQIFYPKGFYSREDIINQNPEIVQADKLIQLAWEQDGIYQINFKTRYGAVFNNQTTAQQKNKGQQLVKEIQPIINDINSWKQPDQTFKKGKAYEAMPNFYRYLIWQQFLLRIEGGKYFKNPNTFRLNVLSNNDVDFIFGGVSHPFYKVEKTQDQLKNKYEQGVVLNFSDTEEQIKSKLERLQKKKQQIQNQDDRIKFQRRRNMMIPYWNYGRNLKTLGSDFLTLFSTDRTDGPRYSEDTLQYLHNIAHNNQGFILNNPLYSIVNPIFHAYHGFIDLVLQTKILLLKYPNKEMPPKIGNITHLKSDSKEAADAIKTFLLQDMTHEQINSQGKRSQWIDKQNKDKDKKALTKSIEYPIVKCWFENGEPVVDKKYNYASLMITDKGRNLADLYTLQQIKFEVQNSGFFQNCIQLYKSTPNIYLRGNEYLEVELQITRKTMINQTFFVQIVWRGQVIAEKYVPIFEKGPQCPNCPKDQYAFIYLRFPFELLNKYIKVIDQNLNSKVQIRHTAMSEIVARINYNSSAALLLIPGQFHGGQIYFNFFLRDRKTQQVSSYTYKHDIPVEQTEPTGQRDMRGNPIFRSKSYRIFYQGHLLKLNTQVNELFQGNYVLVNEKEKSVKPKMRSFKIEIDNDSVDITPESSLRELKEGQKIIQGKLSEEKVQKYEFTQNLVRIKTKK